MSVFKILQKGWLVINLLIRLNLFFAVLGYVGIEECVDFLICLNVFLSSLLNKVFWKVTIQSGVMSSY